MRIFLVLLLLLSSRFLSAQLVFEKTTLDFGDITAETPRFIDIPFKNSGKQKIFILSFRKPQELVALSKGDLILPDSSNFLRIQVNPKKKGKFAYQLQVFTSDKVEATVINIKGNLKEFPEDMAQYQACPDFNKKPPLKNPENHLIVKTRDFDDKTPLTCSVFLLQNGLDVFQIETKKGSWKGKVPIGFTYFHAEHPNYFPVDTFVYVNVNRNEVLLELKRKPKPVEPIIATIEKDSVPQENPIVLEEKTSPEAENMLMQALVKDSTPFRKSIPELKDIPLNNFDTSYFKPVNVTFVLDVSTSMSADEKFNLMKYAMNQLISILRPMDRISIVTFATNSSVVYPSTLVTDKTAIGDVLRKLRASGQTAGLAGIRSGYAQVMANEIEEGSNIIILITDGAFGSNHKAYVDYLKAMEPEGILLSVVGIKNAPRDEFAMKEIASLGHGQYVPIFNLTDAQQNLIMQIKRSSFKGR